MKYTSENFSEILWSPSETKLSDYLRADPGLLLEKDEKGQTLLHCLGKMGPILGRSAAYRILAILFQCPILDFNIKDNKGNTPLHRAPNLRMLLGSCRYSFNRGLLCRNT